MPISEEQPPIETDNNLASWLTRLFRQARDEDAIHRRAILELVTAGYGGGEQVASYPRDLTAINYSTLLFDTLNPTTSKQVTFNTTNNTFVFNLAGFWMLSVSFSLQGFVSYSPARNFRARLYNVTQALPGEEIIILVGAGLQDIYISTRFLIEVSKSNIDSSDEFRIEVGNASTDIAGGTIINSVIQVTHTAS